MTVQVVIKIQDSFVSDSVVTLVDVFLKKNELDYYLILIK